MAQKVEDWTMSSNTTGSRAFFLNTLPLGKLVLLRGKRLGVNLPLDDTMRLTHKCTQLVNLVAQTASNK